MMNDTKKIIKSLLFKIINYYIYMLIILGNYVALIEGKKNNFCILLINFIFSLIKIIINI